MGGALEDRAPGQDLKFVNCIPEHADLTLLLASDTTLQTPPASIQHPVWQGTPRLP